MNRPVYEGGSYKVLSEKEIIEIHETSMQILEKVGFDIYYPPALDLFEQKGAIVDREAGRVFVPRELVTRCIKQAPSEFVYYGLELGKEITVGGKKVHFGTGGLAIYVLDLDRNKRPSTVRDLANLASLADKLEHVDFFIIPVYTHDVNLDYVDINSYFHAFLHTGKPVMGGIMNAQGLKDVVGMAAVLTGGLENLRRRPFVGFIASITSPLKLSSDQGKLIMDVAGYGLPLATSTAPAAGATSPVTLAGTLVQQNAEALMGVILSQLVNPGTPVFYSAVPVTMDMRTMSFLMGSIESGLMNAAITQMAHYYRLPCYITVGTTDSKLPDAQAAHESASTAMLAALSGGNYIHEAFGMLDGALTASYAQYVIDNDIVGSCLRTLRGIEINQDTLAYEVIAGVGPGGNFLSEEHTVRYMRTETYSPRASDRQQYQRWFDAGSTDSWKRAENIALEILSEPAAVYINPALENKIRVLFPDLINLNEKNNNLANTETV
ncbi:MAG: trimethylamine methyltransferase family protein [Firmicutes bacterium]|nr:trimethylamine methyltransferase family protein [Bacillota bacterium]